MYLNNVIIGGHLTRDPELKTFSRANGSDFTVCDIGIATNRRYNNRTTGQRVEEVCYVDANCFGRFGEIIAEKFVKGMPILIKGRLRWRSWDDNGQTKSKLDIFVEDFSFIPNGTRDDDPAAAGENVTAPASAALPPDDMGVPMSEEMGEDIPF